MRILQICSARLIGGGERYLADLSNALAVRGHDIFAALAPASPVRGELNLPPENFIFSTMRNALDVFSAFELARFAERNEIEIIHGHLGRDYLLTATAARLAKKPFVLTRHVLFPLKRLHKFALRRVRGVIAPSEAIADSLKEQNVFPSEKIETIRYGIDLKRFSSVETKQRAATNFTVGTIGHLAPIKGHDTFIRAAEIVLQKRSDVRFVIVGEDKSRDNVNRRELENLIVESGWQSQIELAGWTDDVRPFLREFDLFVSAAREEAFGLVIVEAMMHNLPVIATRSEGALEIIENGTSGVLIEIENAAEMATAILGLLDDESKRKQLAENGKRRAVENFSLDKMVAETEDFYRRTLARNAS